MSYNSSVNRAVHAVDHYSDPQVNGTISSIFVPRLLAFDVAIKEVAAGVIDTFVTVPKEILFLSLGYSAKVLSVITGSSSLKKFAENQPGILDIVRTACKIVAYAMGTIFSLTLGVIVPRANVELHYKMGLAFSYKEMAASLATKQAELASIKTQTKNVCQNISDVIQAAKTEIANEIDEAVVTPLFVEELTPNEYADIRKAIEDAINAGVDVADEIYEDVAVECKTIEDAVIDEYNKETEDPNSCVSKVAALAISTVKATPGALIDGTTYVGCKAYDFTVSAVNIGCAATKSVINCVSNGYFFPTPKAA